MIILDCFISLSYDKKWNLYFPFAHIRSLLMKDLMNQDRLSHHFLLVRLFEYEYAKKQQVCLIWLFPHSQQKV